LVNKKKTNFSSDFKKIADKLKKETLLEILSDMLLIRNFELRSESAYQNGHVGGFFHSYMGQEAIQTAIIHALGKENWYVTSYRCHALALLLGATPNELMAELYGRVDGNAKGRGGSMHFFTERLLGGHGIVGGQIPIGVGAGLSASYLGKDELSICFMGDGAVAQGSFHESLNLASLWNLPCLFVIENNEWGMGTAVNRAISVDKIAESKASGYGMQAYTINGMDFFECFDAFESIGKEIKKTKRPVLVEAKTQRFRGHSISDPALYRSKEELSSCMEKDPIQYFRKILTDLNFLSDEEFEKTSQEKKEIVKQAMEFASNSPWPNISLLEEDVLAP
jgi:pyruvate dehydrogenase E1 component alpha subunit